MGKNHNGPFKQQDIRLMGIAKHVANRSNDSSIKVGAVIATAGGRVLVTGYNHIPDILTETAERWERPLKAAFVEHAERDAIYKALRKGISVKGCTIYVNYDACTDCARAIIQSGIRRVVTYRFPDTMKQKWKDMSASVHQMYKEAGIKVTFLPEDV